MKITENSYKIEISHHELAALHKGLQELFRLMANHPEDINGFSLSQQELVSGMLRETSRNLDK